MTKTRFPLGDIKSYTPAIDARNLTDVFVLEGRNFLWDSKGPKSGFGTRLLALGEVIEDAGGIAQSIEIGTRCVTFTNRGAYQLSEDLLSWTQILALAPYTPVTDPEYDKWTAAYLSKGIYFAHPEYGMFRLSGNSMTPMSSDTTPGLPFQPQAVAETNGRLIVLGSKHVGWSAPSEAEDFEPALGGAGQVLLSDRVTGNAVTLAAFQLGFLVWTDKDCLLAEFIGGNNVFRFDRLTTKQIPLGAHCVEALPDGSQLICTKQGIYRIENGGEPEQVTPVFNEFFRKVLEHENRILVRLTYVLEADLLYVQLRDWTNHYVRTYVLSLALDKWGLFSERHLGIIRWSVDRGASGYVDSHGVAHKFVETYNREVTPHTFRGLDSSLTIGYIKPPELHGAGSGQGEIDSLLEMQEIFIGGRPARPSWSQATVVDLGEVTVAPIAAEYAAWLRFYSDEPFYWVRHSGAPDGEYFADPQRLLGPTIRSTELDTTRGMPVSFSTLSSVGENYPQAANELQEVCKALTKILTVDDGVTFVMEYDTAWALANFPFFFTDVLNDFDILVLQSTFTGFYPELDFWLWDDWWFSEQAGPVAGSNAYGVHRFAVTIKHLVADLYRVSFAVDGQVIAQITGEQSFYDDPWYEGGDDFFFFNWKSGFGSYNALESAPGNIIPSSKPNATLVFNNVFAREIIVFNDADESKLVERTQITPPAEITVTQGALQNINNIQLVLALPVESVVGDLLIMVMYAREAFTAPAGWTLDGSGAWAWNFDCNELYPTGTSIINKAFTQTTYCYTKVCTADDILAGGVTFDMAAENYCGGMITGFHKADGTTPVIQQKQIETNPNAWETVHGQFTYPIGHADAGKAYGPINGSECPELISDRHGSVGFSFSVAGLPADLQYMAVDVAGVLDVVDVPAAEVSDADDYPMAAHYSPFGADNKTPTSYWLTWNLLTPTELTTRNRMWMAWKPLPTGQRTTTFRVTDDVAPPTVSWPRLHHVVQITGFAGNPSIIHEEQDDRTVVGSFVII